MQRLWSTDEVDERERLSYWVEAVCNTYVQLDCDTAEINGGFYGHIEVDQLATLGISRVTAASQSVRRTPAKIAQATEDFFLVSIQTVGNGTILQDGRTAELEPGDFTLYDSTRPYELVFGRDFQQYVLTLPGSVLRSQLRGTEQLTARKVCGTRGAGNLMISMIKSLAADIENLEPSSVAAVAKSVENIILAGLCSLPGAADPPVSNLTAMHRDQIKAYVTRRLRDPRLSVDEIAAYLRISPSTVHRAFAGGPSSLNAWIWVQRLEGARRDICDPALVNRSISEIAFSWGFNDAAHFSRAFRAHFGCSARELRAVCSATRER
jgi:AraC-like DNA-binding protein